MSKIICEICGTSYPETAQQCPICGHVRSGDGHVVLAEDNQEEMDYHEREYEHVRGGRFSRSNVKKRNKARGKINPPEPAEKKPRQMPREQEPATRGISNGGLAAIAVLLLVAVLAVGCFIVFKYIIPVPFFNGGTSTVTEPSAVPTAPATQAPTESITKPQTLECTELTLSDMEIVLDAAGRAWLLEVQTQPANTTDKITYQSGNSQVATVTEQGRITAVDGGETIVTVTCGKQTAQCKVICRFGNVIPTETEESEEPEETKKPHHKDKLELSHEDVTLSYAGESFTIYAEDDDVDNSDIIWSVGNAAVATVDNGHVEAVGPGYTEVTAKYDGMTAKCIIRCSFKAETEEKEETQAPEATEHSSEDTTESDD